MWCPGWDYSSWALLLSMGGGASGGVRSSTAVILYTVNTSRFRLDDEISTSAAH